MKNLLLAVVLFMSGCSSVSELPLKTHTFPDANVYAAQEVKAIVNPAIVNVTHQVRGEVIEVITVEIMGDRQDRVSTYFFADGVLAKVEKVTKLYRFPKWDDKHVATVFSQEDVLIELDPIDCETGDSCAEEVAKVLNDAKIYKAL